MPVSYTHLDVYKRQPYEELKPVLDTHSKLKDKYDILVNYFKMKYQIDLVAIGNKQFK